MKRHAALAARVLRDPEWVHWHDQALWLSARSAT